MITTAIFTVLCAVLETVLNIIPFSDVAFDLSIFDYLAGIIGAVAYFLPMGTVKAIFSIIVVLVLIRIPINLIKTLWDLIPLL